MTPEWKLLLKKEAISWAKTLALCAAIIAFGVVLG